MNELFLKIAELRLHGIKTKISTFYSDTNGKFDDCSIAICLFRDGAKVKKILPFDDLTSINKVFDELISELEKGAAG